MTGTWERRGTVTVTQNSKEVIGVGTSWTDAQNGPQVGNTFYGPDGQAHEVAVIRSATELWLADEYKGATNAGAAYQIDTTRVDSVPGLASRVAAVLAFAQGQYDNLDMWTQGGVDEDVTLTSPNGESVTVPSLPKMAETCRVAVSEHEAKAEAHPISGVTGLQAALNSMYQKNNILGVVSQSNGVPTGAIIERGSNVNGDYVKFADGTLICTRVRTVNMVVPPGTQVSASEDVSAAFVGTPSVAYNMLFFERLNGTLPGLYGFASTAARFVNSGNTYAANFIWPPQIGTITANSIVQTTLAVGRWY